MSVPLYQFDEFELDAGRFELRRKGRPLRLERIPLELLILLVEREGKLVARQEIIERLWGTDVFVDTEHGINTAVRKIRSALRDDAERPRFVQTVPGKGYRFIATVGGDGNGADPAVVAEFSAISEPEVFASKSLPLPNPEKHFPGTSRPWAKTVAWSAAGLLLLIAAFFLFSAGSASPCF